MTLKYIWRSFQPRLSFPRPFQQSLACFRVARSPSNSCWTIQTWNRNKVGARDKINAISSNVKINKRKSINIRGYKLPINLQNFMQKDSAQAKISSKVVGRLLFDSPCRSPRIGDVSELTVLLLRCVWMQTRGLKYIKVRQVVNAITLIPVRVRHRQHVIIILTSAPNFSDPAFPNPWSANCLAPYLWRQQQQL